ncbi:hypothetical protein KL86DES1_20805 [uncultured Desulfovibrio sp.]|jgi:hypothetical protein|uniref:Uncharacterized protein n=1 Tax=uncultured Desulfovibrio sp. TaxID=167968 RepID=A0A212L594_9BACT|nr:hypothetical protein KL86DES1_20805 [uncultured Desulfovibrio sp.]VZH33706.1 conserved protein of unknown function [Desulfovibrio sp. 86]
MQTVVNNSSKQTTKSHEEKNGAYYIVLIYIDFLTKLSLNNLAVHTIFHETHTRDGKFTPTENRAFHCG